MSSRPRAGFPASGWLVVSPLVSSGENGGLVAARWWLRARSDPERPGVHLTAFHLHVLSYATVLKLGRFRPLARRRPPTTRAAG